MTQWLTYRLIALDVTRFLPRSYGEGSQRELPQQDNSRLVAALPREPDLADDAYHLSHPRWVARLWAGL